MTDVGARIRAVIDSIESICASCMAATSQETWDYLHTRPGSLATCKHTAQRACALMRRSVSDYERRAKLLLGFVP